MVENLFTPVIKLIALSSFSPLVCKLHEGKDLIFYKTFNM